MDAHIINDIDRILRCYKDHPQLGIAKLNHSILNKYGQDEIDHLKSMGYEFTCGEDLVSKSPDYLTGIRGVIRTEITYLSNLEQAIKLMMNSIYGGTSHQAFYWFNIALANDITGEGRNLTHHMERHLNEFWRDAWQTNPDLKKIQDDLGIKLKSADDIKAIIRNSHDNSLVTCVYGDSIDGCSLVNVELDGVEGVMTIEDLYETCKKMYGIKAIDDQGSEHINCPYKILNYKDGKVEYHPVKDIIAHKVTKPAWKIRTKAGKEIIVTNDHSMVVFRDGVQMVVKPQDIRPTDKILSLK